METLISYLIKSSIWLTAFGLVYQLFLRNERFFRLNRLFLLSGLLSAIIFPLITIEYVVFVPQANGTAIAGTLSAGTIQQIEEPFITWKVIVAGIILSGAMVFFFRLMIQTLKVLKAISSSEVKVQNNLKVVSTNIFPFAFSFFSYIIVNPSSSEKEIREIVAHESAHVRQHHWIDLVLAESLRMIQWFNPMAWLYTHFIRQNHEYLADRSALKSTSDPAVYKAILINQLLGGEAIRLGHSFSYSLNKKRFIMMKDTSTSIIRKIKPLLVLPFVAIIFYAFSEPLYQYETRSNESTSSSATVTDMQKGKKVEGTILQENGKPLPGTTVIIIGTTTGTVADPNGKFVLKDVPKDSELAFSFVGFKTEKNSPDFNRKMVVVMKKDTVEKNPGIIIRPNKSNDTKKNPVVFLDGDKVPFGSINSIPPGNIESIEVLKDESAIEKYGEEGKNGVILITTKKTNGQSSMTDVKVTGYASRPSEKEEHDNNQKTYNGDPIFFVVEDMPRFPGGDDALKTFIQNNLQYPEKAKQEGIEGKVYVTFIITNEGKIAEAKVVRGVDPTLDSEALKVVEKMPAWTPGKQRGKSVAVSYTMPINFEL